MSNINENNPLEGIDFPDGVSNASNLFAANAPISNSIFQTCTTDNFLNYFFQGAERKDVVEKMGAFGGKIVEETYVGGGIEKVYRTNRYVKKDGIRQEAGTVVLIIGTDGAEILKTHNGLVPKKGEQIILLEKNDNDFSGAIMRFKQDTSININKSAVSLTSFINKRYEITLDQFKDIVNRVDNTSALESLVISILDNTKTVRTVATVGLALAGKMIDSAIKGFDEFVDGSLKIDPSFWNPDHKDFKQKVNVTSEQIKELTASLDVIGGKVDGLSFKSVVAAGGAASVAAGPFALAFLAPGAVAYKLYSEEIELVFDKMKAQIKSALKTLKEFLNNTLESLIKGINTTINVVLAFISGVWSGLVDFVADIIRLFLFLVKLAVAGAGKVNEVIGVKEGDSKAFVKNFGLYYNLILENIDNTLQGLGAVNWLEFFKESFLKFELLKIRILAKIFDKAGKTLDGLNYAEWAYYIAYAILLIADIILSFFFPGLLATKIAKLGKAGKVLAKIIVAVQDAMALVFKIGFKTVAFGVKSIIGVWSSIVGILRKGTKKLLEFLDVVFANLAKVFDEVITGVSKAAEKAYKSLFNVTERSLIDKLGLKVSKYEDDILTLCPIGK